MSKIYRLGYRNRKVNASEFFNTGIHKIQKPKLIKDH